MYLLFYLVHILFSISLCITLKYQLHISNRDINTKRIETMATPLTIAIPPLQERQTIAAWEPLFIAAVSAIDQKAAIKLLPAYVKRGRLEEKVVLGAMGKETLADAFTYLKERLDPEVDMFDAAANFRRMAWSPGEAIQDFFTRYLEEQ